MKICHILGFLALLCLVEAQFRFPELPTPPRIFFGGFRPFFGRSRRFRPRPQPQFIPADQFLEQNNFIRPPQPQPQVFQQSRPSQPPIQFRPPPQFQSRPPTPPQTRPPQTQRPVIIQQSRPQQQQQQGIQLPQVSSHFRPPPTLNQNRPAPPPQTRPPQQQQVSINSGRPLNPQSLSTFRPSPQILSSNNIIGMRPPPPPGVDPVSNFIQPQPPVTQRPQIVTVTTTTTTTTASPNRPRPLNFGGFQSNSVEDLAVNPVPAVNAGVLPLANELPNQLQLFPPLGNLSG